MAGAVLVCVRLSLFLCSHFFLQNVIMTLHTAFLNLTHENYYPAGERVREARRKTLYRMNSTCSFQGGNWTHEKCRFTLHKTFTYCSIKNRLSTVVHFSRPFDALSSKWLPSFLHTCVILCIPLLYLLSDNILYAHLPSTFAFHSPFTSITFISDGHKMNFIHSLDTARFRMSK